MLQLTVKTLRGQVHNVQATSDSTVFELKQIIQTITQMPPDQMRLIYAGKQLEDGRQLGSYNIQSGSQLHLVQRLVGDIGVFDTHPQMIQRDLLIHNQKNAQEEAIRQLISRLGGNSDQKYFQTKCAFSEQILTRLKVFADANYEKAIKQNMQKSQIEDLKTYLTRQQLANLIGQQNLQLLSQLFGDQYNEIVIRRCEAHGKFINFHTDVSLRTLQLCLNDDSEYVGGKLIYARQGKLEIPVRQKGCITIHNNQIVHGVTQLESGIRYGLFLLQKEQ